MVVNNEVLTKEDLSSHVYCDPTKRHDFVFLFDVSNGNPNGDPDNGNSPRQDPETGLGITTDACIKRKVRNWIDTVCGTEERYKIYIQDKGIALNTFHERAYTASDIKSGGSKQKREDVEIVQAWMCKNFYDIRMFGAVMNTSINCGQVWGPLQISFSRSIDPITPLMLSITRVAITKTDADKKTEMGRKPIIPYGLYIGHGSFNPFRAQQTGVTSEDLVRFWEAFQGMWDFDRSAARGELDLRGLYIFTHDSKRGNGHAYKLLERIVPRKQEGISVPRHFNDYVVAVDQNDLPKGITLTQLV
jgi:CRISPR-associated protein Csd2